MKRFKPQKLDENTWKLSTKIMVVIAKVLHSIKKKGEKK